MFLPQVGWPCLTFFISISFWFYKTYFVTFRTLDAFKLEERFNTKEMLHKEIDCSLEKNQIHRIKTILNSFSGTNFPEFHEFR